MQKFRSILLPLTKSNTFKSLPASACNESFSIRGVSSINHLSKTTSTVDLKYQFYQPITKMSTNVKEPLIAQHDSKSKKFFIKLGQDEAKLEYTKQGDLLNMWHTEVPPELQGKGIAKILAKEAFDYVVKNNLKMKLTCSYLQKYHNDNPKEEYTERVVA